MLGTYLISRVGVCNISKDNELQSEVLCDSNWLTKTYGHSIGVLFTAKRSTFVQHAFARPNAG